MADDEKPAAKGKSSDADSELLSEARSNYEAGYEYEQDNIRLAYDDLAFKIGEGQWDPAARAQRLNEGLPCVTINVMPQYVRQITGDMRLSKPSIKVVPVDDRGDDETADVLAGLTRYIENRSDADAIYTTAADSQVSCGIGYWRVTTEYAEATTFNQEIRISGIEDSVGVICDPDAVMPTREDAKWYFIPVDISRAAYEERYPDQPVTDWGTTADGVFSGWVTGDTIRISEYWYKKPAKRLLALLPNGSIDDLTDDDDPVKLEGLKASGARIEEREGFKVYRAVITCGAVLEGPTEWPGRYIPIVPIFGEETRIGRKLIRNGIVRNAMDGQRLLNYFESKHAEVVALQPKAPWLVTDKNIELFRPEWQKANREARAFLRFTPDPTMQGFVPQRVSPPVSSQGISEGIDRAHADIQRAIGIYDASLGQKSNETSGKAIQARQREGDVGSYVYTSNWVRGIKFTGRICLDLIPHVYDTERAIRIVGEDGKEKPITINQTQIDGTSPEGEAIARVLNDVTLGAYDVVMDTGPSFSTRREEAREMLIAFLQSAGEDGKLFLDILAKSTDLPNADEIAKRIELILPPQIQAEIRKERGEPEQPPQQDPAQQAAMQMAMMQEQSKTEQAQLEVQSKALDVELKKLELQKMLLTPIQPTTSAQAPISNAQPAEAAPDPQVLEALQAIGQQLASNVQADHRQQQEIDGIKQLMGELAQMIGFAPQNSGAPQPPM